MSLVEAQKKLIWILSSPIPVLSRSKIQILQSLAKDFFYRTGIDCVENFMLNNQFYSVYSIFGELSWENLEDWFWRDMCDVILCWILSDIFIGY